jgi:hypothetical protein
MAVLLQLTVTPATHEQFDQLDVRVGQSMMQAGGPPAGLMSHVVYPQGEGLVVADVWRTRAEGQPYVDEVLRPLLIELGLTAAESTVLPVWSFARPWTPSALRWALSEAITRQLIGMTERIADDERATRQSLHGPVVVRIGLGRGPGDAPERNWRRDRLEFVGWMHDEQGSGAAGDARGPVQRNVG